VASACHHRQPPPDYAHIRHDQFVLNGVAPDLLEAQVRATLGDPVKVIDWPAEKGSGGPSTEWHYDQLTVKLRQGRVVEATCIQQTCSTADSLAVGDSVTTMNAIYGPSFTVYTDNTLGATIYKVDGRGNCELRVDHEHDIVIGLEVMCY
jgi:hypothetical protein